MKDEEADEEFKKVRVGTKVKHGVKYSDRTASPTPTAFDSDQKHRDNAISSIGRPKKERVLYPRGRAGMSSRPRVTGGRPITQAEAVELRTVVFGSATSPLRGEWLRTGLVFSTPAKEHAYGLRSPRSACRGLLSVLQAYLIKHFLFDKRPAGKGISPEILLKPSQTTQTEALWTCLAAILWTIGERRSACVALPDEASYVEQSHVYFHDSVTEKLKIFEFNHLEDLQIFIKLYLHLFQEQPGAGALLLLYGAVLTRSPQVVLRDLDAPSDVHLVGLEEEGSLCVVTLLISGRATPFLHNGVIYAGDEDHYALPQFGVLSRSAVGLLVYDGDGSTRPSEESRRPGSRLKTPALPVWVTCCQGHYGVMFNTNMELLRNYHAEKRFELQYYSTGGNHVVFTVDTRGQNEDEGEDGGVHSKDDMVNTPLEKLIHTKWQDAKITWTGQTPTV